MNIDPEIAATLFDQCFKEYCRVTRTPVGITYRDSGGALAYPRHDASLRTAFAVECLKHSIRREDATDADLGRPIAPAGGGLHPAPKSANPGVCGPDLR